jgi:MoxR-like ATPase
VEGVTHALPEPYLVIATENPVEQHGTYPLPEGQLDRFSLTVQVGYPDAAGAAAEIVRRQLLRHPIQDLKAVLGPHEVVRAQSVVRAVHVDDAILEYVVSLIQATRAAPEIALGASPRSTVALTRCAQARAVAQGRDYVLPDDVKALASAALAHRLIPRQARAGAGLGREVVRRILDQLPVPLHVAGTR